MSVKMTHVELLKALSAEAIQFGDQSIEIHGVGTDSRKDLTGQVFFALRGERFDGHHFLNEVFKKKQALAVIVDQWPISGVQKSDGVSVFKVNDTLKALQDLAAYWRRHCQYKVLAITGSNGKTTSKMFTAQILEGYKKFHYSPASFNNHIGVPLTLLDANVDDEVVICEMGMNHKGELAHLANLSEPDVVVCTTVGRAHFGFFESQEEIAQSKQEIYTYSPKALKIFNLDNYYTKEMALNEKKNSFKSFSSFDSSATVCLFSVSSDLDFLEIQGEIDGVFGHVKVPVFGKHNVYNLMVAACLALSVGMEPKLIWEKMAHCKPYWGRGQILKMDSGPQILFDGYNANPDSMSVLIDNLNSLTFSGKKVAVFGDMLELGNKTDKLHEELGETVAQSDLERIWFIGQFGESFKRGFKKDCHLSSTIDKDIADQFFQGLNNNDLVALKASRGVGLEALIRHWGYM